MLFLLSSHTKLKLDSSGLFFVLHACATTDNTVVSTPRALERALDALRYVGDEREPQRLGMGVGLSLAELMLKQTI